MKTNKKNKKMPDWAWLILLPTFLYGMSLIISKIFPGIPSLKVLLWMKFIALSSPVVLGGFYAYYILTYGFMSDISEKKTWHSKRILALLITIFLIMIFGIMIFTSIPTKDAGVIIFGVLIGSIYVMRGGSLPNWMIEFTQKFNFFSGGTITADDDPNNLSPKIYLPIIFSAILLALLAYGIFIKGY